ncbi:hypothetical protein [Stakelama tenebrarum]|uniref:Uncharacterized protein n=1 Tax=Stakelama tenebrarum TaxID=2711215 RepID=A0A6G6Y9K3_9SPHN|nr:hypothetical protein [Sphingosinithalassobacter tenebrarum]QIG81599.1 hypothetical protein G5C33_18605 [Sphingosinithalassobacter tenebrarum]
MSVSDFEIKIYELNYARNEHAHELRWKFMYSYVAGSLAFWGLVFTVGKDHSVPLVARLLPAIFAIFGWLSYHALRQNMRVRGQVMQELEDKAGVRGWQSFRRATPKAEWQKPLVFLLIFFGERWC